MKQNVGKKGSIVYTLDQVEHVVDEIYPLFEQHAVITLTGSLGAGKTTLTQALLKRAGVAGLVQSPTFNYMNRHMTKDGTTIYHFDLYRFHSPKEFQEAGFDEYLYQPNSKVLIEWPAVIMPLLKHDVCHLVLDYEGLEMRRLAYQCV